MKVFIDCPQDVLRHFYHKPDNEVFVGHYVMLGVEGLSVVSKDGIKRKIAKRKYKAIEGLYKLVMKEVE